MLATRADGDGAGTLVQAWATRHEDGTVDVLVGIVAHCPADLTWPDEALSASLRAAGRLHEDLLPDVTPDHGTALFGLDLSMPEVARIRLTPGSASP